MSTREFLIMRRNVERAAFRKVLDALPGERWEYSPHERSPSTRTIVWTMVAENHACCDSIRQNLVDWGQVPAQRMPTKSGGCPRPA